jgi:hypothetical protein
MKTTSVSVMALLSIMFACSTIIGGVLATLNITSTSALAQATPCQVFFNQSSYNTTVGRDITITINITNVEYFVSGQLDLGYDGNIIYLYSAPTDGIIYDGDLEEGDISIDTDYRLLGSQGPYSWDGVLRLVFDCPWSQQIPGPPTWKGGDGTGPSGDGHLTQLTFRANQVGTTEITFMPRLQVNQILNWEIFQDYSYYDAGMIWGTSCSVTVNQSSSDSSSEGQGGSHPWISGCSDPTATPTVTIEQKPITPVPTPTAYAVIAREDALLSVYEDNDRVFTRLERDTYIAYHHQRKIDDLCVNGDYILYRIDKDTGEIIEKVVHWRDDLPEHLPTTIPREEAEALVEGEVESSSLHYIPPGSAIYPIEPTPKNPCWVVSSIIDGMLRLVVIDAVTGEFLGYGLSPGSRSPSMLCLYINSEGPGSVVKPGEGEFFYPWGKEVLLRTEPVPCCSFYEWSGDIETIADVYGHTTTVMVYDTYSITAVFRQWQSESADWVGVGVSLGGFVLGVLAILIVMRRV